MDGRGEGNERRRSGKKRGETARRSVTNQVSSEVTPKQRAEDESSKVPAIAEGKAEVLPRQRNVRLTKYGSEEWRMPGMPASCPLRTAARR